jgi:hypothetical protein
MDKLVFRHAIPMPVHEPREVLIRVGAAEVNNTDVNTLMARYSKSNASGSDASWTGSAIALPLIQGDGDSGHLGRQSAATFGAGDRANAAED